MSSPAFANQISNRNFLSPTGFKFTLAKEPKAVFFCTNARIPEITLQLTVQPNYLKDIDIPGTKMMFNDFTLRFLVDEDLENYMEIQRWMRGIEYPETLQEIYDWQSNNDNIEQPTDLTTFVVLIPLSTLPPPKPAVIRLPDLPAFSVKRICSYPKS
mgnify:CR=1 FL=1